MDKVITISNLCKKLKLVDSKTKKPLSYILRYWEKEFKQVKPKKINNRRYYSKKDIEIISFIKFLVKDQKVSIKAVKNMLLLNRKELDDCDDRSLKNYYFKNHLKLKSRNLLDKIQKLKNYGKKNSS